MKTTAIILGTAFFLLIGAKAQDNTESSETQFVQKKSELGVAAGFSTGYGLSYRFWPKKVGVQLTAFPMISSKESYISLGLTGLYELDAKRWYRFFAFIGTHLNFQDYEETNYNNYVPTYDPYGVATYDYTTTRVKKTKYTAGFGPGIEFTPGGRIGFNIMTGFQFQYVDKNDWGTYPTIETGVYFRF